jgi:hypothetical protein
MFGLFFVWVDVPHRFCGNTSADRPLLNVANDNRASCDHCPLPNGYPRRDDHASTEPCFVPNADRLTKGSSSFPEDVNQSMPGSLERDSWTYRNIIPDRYRRIGTESSLGVNKSATSDVNI